MRDLNNVLREKISKVELKCILTILELTVDKGEVALAVKENFKEFTGHHVCDMTRLLVMCGLIVSRKVGLGTYLTCVDNENARNILENKPALTAVCVLDDFHNLISITQCEALEVLASALTEKTPMMNICELSRDNHFKPVVMSTLLKYLSVSGIIDVERYKRIGTKITILDDVMFKYIVKKVTMRINAEWECG